MEDETIERGISTLVGVDNGSDLFAIFFNGIYCNLIEGGDCLSIDQFGNMVTNNQSVPKYNANPCHLSQSIGNRFDMEKRIEFKIFWCGPP